MFKYFGPNLGGVLYDGDQGKVEPMEMRVISLFSGAMGLDLGLEQVGIGAAICVERDPLCCATIRRNRPSVPVTEADIASVSTEKILQTAGLQSGAVFAVVGGPPCQSFSTGGKRQTIQDPRGDLFNHFLRVVREAQPHYFVFENVAQIITAAAQHRPIAERPGQRWHLSSYRHEVERLVEDEHKPLADHEQAGSALDIILGEFSQIGYTLTFGVLNAADYGAPQRRLRFVLLGTRAGPSMPLPRPTHSAEGANGLPPWRTLRDAIGDLEETAPLHSSYGPAFQRYFQLVPPGGNWRNLPAEVGREALGEKAFVAGGGKTGFFRRLAWDAPAPTIVGKPNRKSSAICHPSALRPLTVRESARVQGFPDEWAFMGGMHAQYMQIGNAVPVQLGAAIGRTLLEMHEKASQPTLQENAETVRQLWGSRRDEMLATANAVLRRAARNKQHGKRRPQQPSTRWRK